MYTIVSSCFLSLSEISVALGHGVLAATLIGYNAGMKLPRFPIRDLLWFAAIAALVSGWRIDHSESARQRKLIELQLRNLPFPHSDDATACLSWSVPIRF
jgi:hypothetical protein